MSTEKKCVQSKNSIAQSFISVAFVERMAYKHTETAIYRTLKCLSHLNGQLFHRMRNSLYEMRFEAVAYWDHACMLLSMVPICMHVRLNRNEPKPVQTPKDINSTIRERVALAHINGVFSTLKCCTNTHMLANTVRLDDWRCWNAHKLRRSLQLNS